MEGQELALYINNLRIKHYGMKMDKICIIFHNFRLLKKKSVILTLKIDNTENIKYVG